MARPIRIWHSRLCWRRELDGLANQTDPGPANHGNLYEMSEAELSSRKIGFLPTTVAEAIDAFEKDPVIREGLGAAFSDEYIKVKREEWRQYNQSVHPWELDRYLGSF